MFNIKILRYLLPCFLWLVIMLTSVTSVYADDGQNTLVLKSESVNPGDDYRFVLKRLKEKVLLSLYSYSSNKKYEYWSGLVGVRLAELKDVVDRKDIANIQTASQRYSAMAGQLTEFVLAKKTDKKHDLKTRLSSQIPILEGLRDSYEYNIGEYRFIQDDINSINSYNSKLE